MSNKVATLATISQNYSKVCHKQNVIKTQYNAKNLTK